MTDQTQTSPTDQQLLTNYLALREDRCPSCHYNIHKLTTDTCPECGEKLKIQVALKTPKLAAFVVGLIALSISAGFPLLFACLLIIYFFVSYPDVEYFKVAGCSIALSLIVSVPMFFWYRYRAKLIRSTNLYRWPLVLLTWLTCPISLIIIFVVMEYFI